MEIDETKTDYKTETLDDKKTHKLIVKKITTQMCGYTKYHCKVTNKVGTKTTTATLGVKSKPQNYSTQLLFHSQQWNRQKTFLQKIL